MYDIRSHCTFISRTRLHPANAHCKRHELNACVLIYGWCVEVNMKYINAKQQ